MNKKVLIISGAILLAIIIGVIIYFISNKNLISVVVESKIGIVYKVDTNGTIKEVKALNKYSENIKLENVKNKKINEGIRELLQVGIDKKILNEDAYSYNVSVKIISKDKDVIKNIKKIINDEKLPNNEAGIELLYSDATEDDFIEFEG